MNITAVVAVTNRCRTKIMGQIRLGMNLLYIVLIKYSVLTLKILNKTPHIVNFS